jgi:hypothetical protein
MNCTATEGLRDPNGNTQFCCYEDNSDCCAQPAQLFTAPVWNFTSSPTSSPTSAASSATSSAPSPTASFTKTSPGTNSKGIGIGVGVGVAVALAAIFAAWLLWRRRRRRHGHHSVGSSSSADTNPHSLPPVQERNHAYPEEIDGRAAAARAYELESMRKPVELHGSEPDGRYLNTQEPRIMRPSSVNKPDDEQ